MSSTHTTVSGRQRSEIRRSSPPSPPEDRTPFPRTVDAVPHRSIGDRRVLRLSHRRLVLGGVLLLAGLLALVYGVFGAGESRQEIPGGTEAGVEAPLVPEAGPPGTSWARVMRWTGTFVLVLALVLLAWPARPESLEGGRGPRPGGQRP